MQMPFAFFVANKGKKIQKKLTKIVKKEEVKNSYLLRDMMNFNQIFGKKCNLG